MTKAIFLCLATLYALLYALCIVVILILHTASVHAQVASLPASEISSAHTDKTSSPTHWYFGMRLQNANVQALNDALQAASSPTSQYPRLGTVAFGMDYGVRHWFGNTLVDGTLGLAFAGGRAPNASSAQSSENGVRSSLVSITLGGDFGYRVWSHKNLSLYPTLGFRGEMQSLSFTERSQTPTASSAQQISTNWSSVSTKQTTTRTLSMASGNIIPVVGVGAEYNFTWTARKRCGCDGQSGRVERDGVVFVHLGYMTGGLLRGVPVATWNNEGQSITDLPNAFSQGVTLRVGFGFDISRPRVASANDSTFMLYE